MRISYLKERCKALLFGLFVSIIPLLFVAVMYHDPFLEISVFLSIILIIFFYSYRMFKNPIRYWRFIFHSVISGLLAILLSGLIFSIMMTVLLAGKAQDLFYAITVVPLFFSLMAVVMLGIPASLYMWLVSSLFYLLIKLRRKFKHH